MYESFCLPFFRVSLVVLSLIKVDVLIKTQLILVKVETQMQLSYKNLFGDNRSLRFLCDRLRLVALFNFGSIANALNVAKHLTQAP